MSDNDTFCSNCGTKVEDMAAASQQTEEAPKSEEAPHTETQSTATINTAGISHRSIALAIIFSIITCGIYTLYWLYKMNDNINQLAGDDNATSGGLVILFSIITCGIYSWYWYYKMGQKMDTVSGTDSNKILFIVFAIIGLGIVNLAIMQDFVNKEIEK